MKKITKTDVKIKSVQALLGIPFGLAIAAIVKANFKLDDKIDAKYRDPEEDAS